MSNGGRHRASVGMKVWKSSQKWSVRRSAVRSIAWLDPFAIMDSALVSYNPSRFSQRVDEVREFPEGSPVGSFAVLPIRRLPKLIADTECSVITLGDNGAIGLVL